MTREEIYASCLSNLKLSNTLLLEAATGTGKTKISIDVINHLCDTVFKGRKTKMLLLVAKRVHKQTWKNEFQKWGGIHASEIIIECYESLKKHTGESFDFIIADEVHHIGSDIRLEYLSSITFTYMMGLSATIPRKTKRYFRDTYKAKVVSCNILEAIEDDILPEPEIVLFPLELDNTSLTETLEINPKSKGPIYQGFIRDLWNFKKKRVHAIISCTQRQKLNELNKLIEWQKNLYIRTSNKVMEKAWLHQCGKRLEYLANSKNSTVLSILKHLKRYRTITFCRTIEQAELLGKHCIHSQNKDAELLYDKFNSKKINHITAVNILNENANLVSCKYAIFANISSSEVIIPQRLGRAMRHKHPVIIVPYYKDTREEEIVKKMFESYDKRFIRVIKSIEQL